MINITKQRFYLHKEDCFIPIYFTLSYYFVIANGNECNYKVIVVVLFILRVVIINNQIVKTMYLNRRNNHHRKVMTS